MRNIRKVTLNRETFHANCGDLLLDSAMLNGIGLPHDCRAGILRNVPGAAGRGQGF